MKNSIFNAKLTLDKFILLLCFSFPIFNQAQRVETSTNGERVSWGKFEINNNQWGIYKIKKGEYLQTIYSDGQFAGWKWKTPGKSYGVLGYPMVFLGTSAWNSLDQIKEENYFKNFNHIKSFKIDYQTILTVNNKKYNLAFDFWLHHSPNVAFETISTEVMIWEDYNKFKPFGKKYGKLTTATGEYEVYIGNIYKKELKKGWKYIAFLRLDKRQSGTIDLLEFIIYLKQNQLLQANPYLSSFEFGTEILNSNGEIKILKYEVDIK